MSPFQYIVLHKSCMNDIGFATAQAAHAASECLRSLPVPPHTAVGVLMAETSDELEMLSVVLKMGRIHHVLIREPDAPYHGAAVALGVEPMDRELVRAYFKDLKPLRNRPNTSAHVAQRKSGSLVDRVGGSSPSVGSTSTPVAQRRSTPGASADGEVGSSSLPGGTNSEVVQ